MCIFDDCEVLVILYIIERDQHCAEKHFPEGEINDTQITLLNDQKRITRVKVLSLALD